MATGVYRISGPPNIHNYTSAAAVNTFYAGDLVGLTSGVLVIGAHANILGIALKTCTGTATDVIPVDVIAPDDSDFIMKYVTTTAVTLKGTQHNITFSAGAQVVNATDDASNDCAIIDLDARDAVALSGGRLIVHFPAVSVIGSQI